METPILDYVTPVRRRSALTSGGLANTIAVIAGVVVVLGLLLPPYVGAEGVDANGLRVLLTWVLLLLGGWYVVDRLLSEPDRPRIALRWVAATSAILFVYVQIWWFKDHRGIQPRGWSLTFLWPSVVALGCVVLFAALSGARRPAAG